MLMRAIRAICAGLGVTVICLAGHTSATSPDLSQHQDYRPAVLTAEAALRHAGLSPSQIDNGTQLVAAAVADLDADGDLDLVATDGSLDLLVWDNDGAGHFTRKYPKHAPAGALKPRDGSVDDGPANGTVSVVLSDASALAGAPQSALFALQSDRRVASTTPLPRLLVTPASRPRAPPVSSTTL